jgi:hypothetical protein
LRHCSHAPVDLNAYAKDVEEEIKQIRDRSHAAGSRENDYWRARGKRALARCHAGHDQAT